MPHLKELHARHADDGLVIVGVHTQRSAELMAGFVEKESIPYPVCIDAEGQTVQAFGVNSYPDYYVVDRSGVLRYADLANADLDRAVTQLLAEPRESVFASTVRSWAAAHPRLAVVRTQGAVRSEIWTGYRFGRTEGEPWVEVERRTRAGEEPVEIEVARLALEPNLPLLRYRRIGDGGATWDLVVEEGKLKGKSPGGSVLRNLEAHPTSELALELLAGPLAGVERRHRASGGIGPSRQLVRWLDLGRELRVREGQLEALPHPDEVEWVGIGWHPDLGPSKFPTRTLWFGPAGDLLGIEARAARGTREEQLLREAALVEALEQRLGKR